MLAICQNRDVIRHKKNKSIFYVGVLVIILRYILVSIYRRMNIRAPHGIFPISTLLLGKEGKNSQLVRPAELKDDNIYRLTNTSKNPNGAACYFPN
jgi:hypothetical protein